MDPAWNNPPPKGTLPCILCKSVISFPNKDKKKYFKHMQKDHGAFYNINLILIINLLERKQILKLIANIKSGETEEKKKSTSDAEVQTEVFFNPTVYEPITEEDIVVVDSGYPIPQPMMMSGSRNTTDPDVLNKQIDEIRKYLGQMGDEVGKDTLNDDSINDSDGNLARMNENNIDIENSNSNSQGFDLPNDLELEEVITISTPKPGKAKKERRLKKEFMGANASQDSVDEVMIEDDEDFNILDVTNDDLVLTAAGPQPIEDYTSFVPGSVIPPSYNPTEVLEIDSVISTVEPDTNEDTPTFKHKFAKENVDNFVDKKSKKDDITKYLLNCSEYFQKFPKQIVSCSQERAHRFTEKDPSLPPGWKVQIFDRKAGKSLGRQDKEYLSPEMKVFRSRIAVVEYMKAMGGYSDDEMFKVLPVKVKSERN